MKTISKILKNSKGAIELSPIFSEVEMTYKNKVKTDVKLTGSNAAADALRAIWSNKMDYIEEFVVLCLNRQHKVICWAKISQGGTAAIYVDNKVIFQLALTSNASAIIISHNHPSGNLQPSPADIQQTEAIVSGAQVLGLTVLEHIILTTDGYYSFSDEGLI